MIVRSKQPGNKQLTDSSTGLSWPEDIYSLAHVALQISASSMLRLRWNPFYPYVEERVLKFLELEEL